MAEAIADMGLRQYLSEYRPLPLFDAVGLPGFQFIQDEIEYGRGYHTVMDTYERLVMADLRQNAIITASFAYNAAMRDAKLPGKPVLKSISQESRRPAPVMN
jgi:Zn-dependent M28 family amino/carboxypeptidase